MKIINSKEFKEIVIKIKDEIVENSDKLSMLDQKIGDGDHGTNMKRGFEEVVKIENANNLKEYIYSIGMVLMSKVGGASGPLYGMSFINSTSKLNIMDEFSWEDFQIFVDTFVNTLQTLGKSQPGEKTMLDVWFPLKKEIDSKNKIDEKYIKKLIDKIDGFIQSTENMIATKGRSSYLKERSFGTIDPGSFSSGIIIKNILLGFI